MGQPCGNQSAAESLVADLVDRGGVRVGWVVADAEGEVFEKWAVDDDGESEDHPETPDRGREVDLEALRELGPVAVLRVAWPEIGKGDAVRLVLAPGCFGGIASSRCRPCHVLAESVGVEASREAQLVGQWLPLAVGGEHVALMLGQEALPLLPGGIASAGALLDGLPGGIGHEGERAVRSLVGDDVLANPITAQLHVVV